MVPLELNDVVSAFEKMLRRTIREDIQMDLDLSPSISLIRGDISMIEQVLMNLAINAQDAMPNGGTLSIETDEVVIDNDFSRKHQIRPDRYVTLTVRDSGSGIEAEHFEHLFEPFFTTKAKGKGTGLGLASVYGIVKQHNGGVSFESELGKGTAFTIYLPRSEDTSEVHHKQAASIAGNHGSETVVVVEDDEMVRNLTCTILEDHGYKVYCAGNADECMKLIEGLDRTVDLLVTDVVMPGMNGRELYHRLSETDPELNVLFMSGYMEKLSSNGEAVGEERHFIQKPFSVQHFTRKIREALD
jgi:CheY-like chemotaxis protein